jgi:hypothetical protein
MLSRLLIEWAIDDGMQRLVHRIVRILLLLLILDGKDNIFILASDGLCVSDSFFSFINY